MTTRQLLAPGACAWTPVAGVRGLRACVGILLRACVCILLACRLQALPCRLPHQWSGLRPRVCAKTHTRESRSSQRSRWRPYRVECTGSLPTSEVKRRRARLVLGWGTAREDLRVLPAFGTRSACVGVCCGRRAWAPVAGCVGCGRAWASCCGHAFASCWAVGDCQLLPPGARAWAPVAGVRGRLLLADARPAPAQTATVDTAKRLSKDCLHFSICACHPCAGAMLIFPVSFQF